VCEVVLYNYTGAKRGLRLKFDTGHPLDKKGGLLELGKKRKGSSTSKHTHLKTAYNKHTQ